MLSTFHIVLAMKPTEDNFVQNVLTVGLAGINVDECRVKGAKGNGVWGTSNATINRDRKFNASPDMGDYRSEEHQQGRFPSNLVLQHCEGCKQAGTMRVKGHKGYPNGAKGWGFHGGIGGRKSDGSRDGDRIQGHADSEGKETVDAWECVEGCPTRLFPESAGASGIASGPTRGKLGTQGRFGSANGNMGESCFYGDSGSASRFFKQVKSC